MNQRTEYLGHDVINEKSETLGTVTDVLYDNGANEPKWLVVKPGLLQAERIVPIERSYGTDDGHVVVPFEKKWVKSAPKAGDHVLSDDVEAEAAQHYGIRT